MPHVSFAEANWPCFRGPLGAVVEDAVLPVSWSTTDNVKRKIDVVGGAWCSPVVWGNRIFLTTVASEGHVEEAKKGLYFGGNRNEPSSAIHHWIVYCYDSANDGKLFFLSEDGDTFVVRAGPEFKVLGRNSLNEMCMATPATLRGSIIIRTLSKLYRIGK